jgi:hypothetical protein
MPPLNPIIPGFNPDPSICCVGADFFVATSTFEFFPGVPIYHSTDLINWRLLGHALNRASQLNMRAVPFSGGIWAPTLRHHEGRFYMITVLMHGKGSADVSTVEVEMKKHKLIVKKVLAAAILRVHRQHMGRDCVERSHLDANARNRPRCELEISGCARRRLTADVAFL